MSQHDFNIANQLFPATRADLNNALVALASNSSGDAEPSTTYANQWWYETDTDTLKIRNEANNAWVPICILDQGNNNVLSITTQGLTLGATALTATGLEINKLTGATVSTTELNQLNDITRGSIIYGNASGATARLAKGAAGTVLASDGTDISWAAAGGGVPTGSVIYHTADAAPTGFIKANGAAVSRSTYSDLFSAIGTVFGVGDGSSTFNVPDLRGEFMRGWDNSRGIDSGRSFGSAQADELKAHTHNASVYQSTSNAAPGNVGSGNSIFRKTTAVSSTGGTETRPRNIALLACIKY